MQETWDKVMLGTQMLGSERTGLTAHVWIA